MTGIVTWADQTNLLDATDLASVYRMRNAAGVIIYVGETTQHLAERIRSHRTRGTGGSPWFDEVASIEAAEVPRNARRDLERAEIHRWHPVHNKVCVLCTQEAFALLYKQGLRGYLLRNPPASIRNKQETPEPTIRRTRCQPLPKTQLPPRSTRPSPPATRPRTLPGQPARPAGPAVKHLSSPAGP